MPHFINQAWKVTEKNTKMMSIISGVVEQAFKANIGWILVEDWTAHPNRFLIMPERIFKKRYPVLELTALKVDEEDDDVDGADGKA